MSLQAAEAAKEAASAGALMPQEAGHPPESPRGSLMIKMEPLQDCRSPGIVVRTRLSLSCPTPGHLLSVYVLLSSSTYVSSVLSCRCILQRL